MPLDATEKALVKGIESIILDAMHEPPKPDPHMLYRLRRGPLYASFVSYDGKKYAEHCYTLYPDTNGNFWSFDYESKGHTVVMTRRTRRASAKSAKKLARARCRARNDGEAVSVITAAANAQKGAPDD